MKHDIVITAQGHKGTLERLTQEFSAVKLFAAIDKAAALKEAAPKVRGLAHNGHLLVDAALMDALPKLEIIANFGVGVDQIRQRQGAGRPGSTRLPRQRRSRHRGG